MLVKGATDTVVESYNFMFRLKMMHDDVIKWKHFPRYWPFVRGIHRQRPVTRSFDVFFDLRRINGWVNKCKAGDLRRIRLHYDVTVMNAMTRKHFPHALCTGTAPVASDLPTQRHEGPIVDKFFVVSLESFWTNNR